MNATTYLALESQAKGVSVPKTWGGGWNNATGDQIRKIENQCESIFNTDSEVKSCVQEGIKALDGKGKISWSTGLEYAKGILDSVLQGQQQTTYTNTNYQPPKENKTGQYILIGLGVVALGTAIWYFGFKKK